MKNKMNWRFKLFCAFYLFIPVLVNSSKTENGRNENSTFTTNMLNNSSESKVNVTARIEDSDVLHTSKTEKKQTTCKMGCNESAYENTKSVRNITKFKEAKSNKNNLENEDTGDKKSSLVKDTSRRARKLDKYHWKKDAFTGRGKEMDLLMPLVIGFKLTSVISSAFTAIKIFLVQSMLIAKLAVVGSSILLLKSLYDYNKHKPMRKAAIHLNPFYDYMMPYHSTYDALSYPLGYDTGEWHGLEGGYSGVTDVGTANEDLDTQFSNSETVAVDPKNNNTNKTSTSYYSQRDSSAADRVSNSSKYKPLVIGYETYIRRITTEKRDDD